MIVFYLNIASLLLLSSNREEATKQSKVWAKAFTHYNREIYRRCSMYCVVSNCNFLFDTVRDYDASKRVCVNVQEASTQPPWIARPRSGDGPGVGSCIGKCHCKKKKQCANALKASIGFVAFTRLPSGVRSKVWKRIWHNLMELDRSPPFLWYCSPSHVLLDRCP